MYKINSDVSNDSVYILTIIIVFRFSVWFLVSNNHFITFKYLAASTLPHNE